MRVFLYLIIISIGAYVGYKDLFLKKLSNKLNAIQHTCLLFLLFIMGIKIGINKEIVKTFPKLGFSALIISIFTIVFSVLGVKIISRYILTSRKVKKI